MNDLTGAYVGTVPASILKLAAPDALASLTVGAHVDVFAAAHGGRIAELRVVPAGTSFKLTELRFIKPTGCAAGAATHLVSTPSSVVELCANGTIVVVTASTGRIARTIPASTTKVTDATAIAVSGSNAYVTSSALSGSPTPAQLAAEGVVEVSLSTGKVVRTVSNATCSGCKFSAPDGIAVGGTTTWVAQSATDSATQLTTATFVPVMTTTDGIYSPGAVLATKSAVYIASVNGPVSSMVTRYTSAPYNYDWMMCNTNDVYKFDNPSALALTAFPSATNYLWVANGSNNLLDQMNAVSGLLVKTFT
jgi:hypothetical protein